MGFEHIIGQHGPKRVLQRVLHSGRLAHGYLFHGPEGVGKEAVALELAKAIVCEEENLAGCGRCASCKKVTSLMHPDVIFIFPAPLAAKPEDERAVLDSLVQDPYFRSRPWVNPAISIERIRAIQRLSSLKSFEGSGKVVIIADAEAMTQEASNALLKILEEPPPRTTLILTSARPNVLLPTIVSRCQTIRFELLTSGDLETALLERKEVTSERARLVARTASGSYRQALELLDEDLDRRRDVVVDILRSVLRGGLERLEKVEEIQGMGDKRIIKEHLQLLLLWLRDALLLTEYGDDMEVQDKVVNFDRLELLKKFVAAFEEIDFQMVISEVEHSLAMIDRNVQVGLVLTVLLQRLRFALRRKGNV